MRGTLESRIQALETHLKATQAELYTVHFLDGHKEYYSGGECIGLAQSRCKEIERFVEPDGCKNGGCLCGLLNALLIDESGTN